MIRRLGEPVVRTAVAAAMKLMGEQFVLGRDHRRGDGARRAALEAKGYTYSYDMLGEAARTEADALRYRRGLCARRSRRSARGATGGRPRRARASR